MSFGKPREEKPSDWSPVDGVVEVPGSGGDVYVRVPDSVKPGDKATNVWIWHWHRPTVGAHRWATAGCGLHDVISVDPLHLEASLACEDGCPSHGWIRDGKWVQA